MVSSGPSTVEVPNLAGKSRGEVRIMLDAAGLRGGMEVVKVPSNDVAEDKVVEQYPAAGSRVERNTSVRISVGAVEGRQSATPKPGGQAGSTENGTIAGDAGHRPGGRLVPPEPQKIHRPGGRLVPPEPQKNLPQSIRRLKRHEHPRPPYGELRQKSVLDSGSRLLGDVADLYVDDYRELRFVEVVTSGFIGLGRKHYLVPVEAIAEVVPGSITLRVDQQTMERAPTFAYLRTELDEQLQRATREHYGYG
jgi:hypothetical protein